MRFIDKQFSFSIVSALCIDGIRLGLFNIYFYEDNAFWILCLLLLMRNSIYTVNQEMFKVYIEQRKNWL